MLFSHQTNAANQTLVLDKKNETTFFQEYYSTTDLAKKDQMFMVIYDFYKNMFFKELMKSYTVGKSVDDYETNFKIEFLKALRDFNMDRGFRFSTYLFTKIKAAIQRTNKEESAFSIKEYKLNVLNIYKSKLIAEIQKIRNLPKEESAEILEFDDFEIKNFEGLDLRKIYDEMYAEYKLPKVKYETLIEDLPYIFSKRVANTSDEGQDIMDVNMNKSGGTEFTEIGTEHIDIYFKIKEIYVRNKQAVQKIRLELTKLGFNLACNESELKNFFYNIENGGEMIVYFLENNLTHPEDKLTETKKRLALKGN